MIRLVAKNFECFPIDNHANDRLSPIIEKISKIEHHVSIGDKNSNSFTSDFDSRLQKKLTELGGEIIDIPIVDDLEKKYDFALDINNDRVVVEIEKTNREKILYDLLKCHIYLKSGASLVMLFLPKNYAHSKGIWNLFETGKIRYSQCLKYGFGHTSYFKSILLVGYEMFTGDNEKVTPSVRAKLIAKNKNV